MSSVFLRKYELSIFLLEELNSGLAPPTIQGQSIASSINQDLSSEDTVATYRRASTDVGFLSANDGSHVDYLTESDLAIKITDLHIEASINYKSTGTDSSGQQATISIYNLSPESIKRISENSSILLKAGYEKDTLLPLIFSGQILTVSTERVGENMVTKMVCTDSGLGIKAIRASISFGANTSYKSVIQTLLTEMSRKGIPIGGFMKGTASLEKAVVNGLDMSKFASITDPINNGYNVEGNVFDALQEVCKAVHFRAYVVLGRLYVEPITEPQRTSAVRIEQVGVKGSIKKLSDSRGKADKGSESKSGIRVVMFLNGEISANKFAEVVFGEYEGKYKITSVKHILGYEQGNWDTVIDCLPVGV